MRQLEQVPPEVADFIRDLMEVCKKHNASLSACSCCNHINVEVGKFSFDGFGVYREYNAENAIASVKVEER